MQEKKNKKEQFQNGIFVFSWILLGIYVIANVYLYYMQAIQNVVEIEAGSHFFESDLPYHIKMAVVDDWYYSITGILYKIYYMLPFGAYLVAITLGLVVGLTVYITFKILKNSRLDMSNGISMCLALCLNFMMAAHWDFGHTQWYIGYESGNLWHNSTYLVMRLFAMLCIGLYIRLKESYKEHLSLKDAILYAILLALSTAAKPSFVVVFLPAMAILLFIDFIKGVSVKKILFFAFTVVPSLLLIVVQEMILFGDSTDSGIVIDPWYTLSLNAKHPKVTLVLSLAFPLLVLFFSIKELFRNKLYLVTWIMWGVGLLQMVLLTEVATRANAGNFIWGYAIAIFILNISSLLVVCKQFQTKKCCFNNGWLRGIYFAVAGLVFLYQTVCGIQFFIWMIQGKTYWI